MFWFGFALFFHNLGCERDKRVDGGEEQGERVTKLEMRCSGRVGSRTLFSCRLVEATLTIKRINEANPE